MWSKTYEIIWNLVFSCADISSEVIHDLCVDSGLSNVWWGKENITFPKNMNFHLLSFLIYKHCLLQNSEALALQEFLYLVHYG